MHRSVRFGSAEPVSCARKILAALSFMIGASIAHADNVRGAWSPVYTWPLISVHAVLMPDGRVMTYGTDGNGKQTGYFIYDIWDPSAGPTAGHLTLPNVTNTDIFCSSQRAAAGRQCVHRRR